MRHANAFANIPIILTIAGALSFGTAGLADRIPSTLEQRIGLADTIAEFVVEGVSSRRLTWNGPEAAGGIFTFVDLRTIKVIVGKAEPTITIRVPGGEVPGDEAMYFGDYPAFETGERVILLLSNAAVPRDGTDYALIYCPVIAGELGKYTVIEDAATGSEFVVQVVGSSARRPVTGNRAFGVPSNPGSTVAGQPIEAGGATAPRETRTTRESLLKTIRTIRSQSNGE